MRFRARVLGPVPVRFLSLLVVAQGSELHRWFGLVLRRWLPALPEFLVKAELDLVSVVSEAQGPVEIRGVRIGLPLS